MAELGKKRKWRVAGETLPATESPAACLPAAAGKLPASCRHFDCKFPAVAGTSSKTCLLADFSKNIYQSSTFADTKKNHLRRQDIIDLTAYHFSKSIPRHYWLSAYHFIVGIPFHYWFVGIPWLACSLARQKKFPLATKQYFLTGKQLSKKCLAGTFAGQLSYHILLILSRTS